LKTNSFNQQIAKMKKALSLLVIAGMLSFGAVGVYAQDSTATENTEMVADSNATDSVAATQEEVAEETSAVDEAAATEMMEEEQERGFHQVVKQKFIEGGATFMGIVLVCLILGLAICIERIIYLNLATTNTTKLLEEVEAALQSGGVEAAKEVCRNTRGPVASIFYQGLERSSEGIDMVEKSVISYGSVQMGLLEKGISWISLFIALAPMLGFMGTVIGMISAFDSIEAAGDISPSLVARGIKVALLTTVFGLITAIILQIFYNIIVAKVDSLVNNMEDASISLVDILVKNSK
jgi:biopolymer transport protein ExbB